MYGSIVLSARRGREEDGAPPQIEVRVLASFVTISCVTSNASRRVVGQWGGAGGASCEDHLAFCGELFGVARRLRLGLENRFFNSPLKRRAANSLEGTPATPTDAGFR